MEKWYLYLIIIMIYMKIWGGNMNKITGKLTAILLIGCIIGMANVNVLAIAQIPQLNLTERGMIYIEGDSQFNATNGVISGTGTSGDPYIISGWEINGTADGYGIIISETDAYCIITNCTLYESNAYPDSSGILLYQCANITITDCNLIRNEIGVGVYESNNIIVMECYLEENGVLSNESGGVPNPNIMTGILVLASNNVTVSNNELYNELTDGIRIYQSDYCIVEENYIDTCEESGIEVTESSYCEISNNYVINCLQGFYGYASMLNTKVCQNTFTGSQEKGIFLYNTDNNSFYYNNLYNNNANVLEYNEVSYNGGIYTNIWYNDSLGNYWDDYGGSDENSDGVGETPYKIYNQVLDEVNEDPYPLVEPYPIVPTNETDADLGLSDMLIAFMPLIIILLLFKIIVEQVSETMMPEKKKKE